MKRNHGKSMVDLDIEKKVNLRRKKLSKELFFLFHDAEAFAQVTHKINHNTLLGRYIGLFILQTFSM